jgi:hypothetical protein
VVLYYGVGLKDFHIKISREGNLFRWNASIIITNHFEDTPREAVKAKTLTASLLLGLPIPKV